MTSKSAKLRSHRVKQGRPRKQDVPRHPCGQINKSYAREETEREVKMVAVEALKRVHGLDYDSNGYSGYTLGRLFLDGRITAYEREAGDEYAQQMSRYYGATGIQFPSARAQSLFSIKGYDGEVSSERARLARELANKMMKLEGILLRLEDGPRVKTTVYNTCIQDYEIMRTMSEMQLSWLKRGLQEIHFQLGLSREKEPSVG
ncbi:hypothetical protein D9M72_495780 [compost metagenome]